MNKKIRVAILFGGKSAEHEVSIRSAKSIYEAIDKEKYEPVLIGINKSGKWFLGDSRATLPKSNEQTSLTSENKEEVALLPDSGER